LVSVQNQNRTLTVDCNLAERKKLA
jgi:hypothetical protein